jgi:predicted ATPase/C4-dicarboxylate-specific signal transduction histidine kinase
MTEITLREMILLRAGDVELYRQRTDGDRTVLLASASVEGFGDGHALLQREFAMRTRLDPSWSAYPLTLTHQLDRVHLGLRDPGGVILRSLCASRLPVQQFLILALSVASAVARMHAAGVIHRDIAPENILVDPENGRAWLTGFGNAVDAFGSDAPSCRAPVLSGLLNYMAPELSGRTNRVLDARADLYALGSVFYELVTGGPPVVASDALGAVHSHMATRPPSPSKIRHGFPQQISEIIEKLVAKDPNDRYASAHGLVEDLQWCLATWQTEQAIASFPLDHANILRRLSLPDRLYGRERELNLLASAFARVAGGGATEMVIVSGESGSGKSAVVREFDASIRAQPHLFVAGKCAQVDEVTPYGALSIALNGLIQMSLREDAESFAATAAKVRHALRANAALLAALLPDLGLLIGEFPAVPEVPAQAEKDRFFDTVRRFVSCFASPTRPVVLFLDDLQWADSGTLGIMAFFRETAGLEHLLLIGAVRNEALESTHCVQQTLAQEPASVLNVPLDALTLTDINELVSDALGCDRQASMPLAKLIRRKTGGNPFFATRFLAALLDEGLVHFDRSRCTWVWDLERIQAKQYTSNVADLLLNRLESLDDATLALLRHLACLGDRASSRLLCMATGAQENDIHAHMTLAEHAGIVRWDGATYSFWHDRIRETIYGARRMQELREAMHLDIGRRLAEQESAQASRELIFVVANQINLGAGLIRNVEERLRYTKLNLAAGLEAKLSANYHSALAYLVAASELLQGLDDNATHCLIEYHRAECELMTAQLADADERLIELSGRTMDFLLTSSTVRLRVVLYTTMGRQQAAVAVGLEFLNRIGVKVSMNPVDKDVDQARDRLMAYVDARQLTDGPREEPHATPEWSGVMDVLSDMIPPALFCNITNLTDSIGLTLALIAIEKGHSNASSYALVCAAATMACRFHDRKRSLALGTWSVHLSESPGIDRFAARVKMCFAVGVLPWTEPIRAGQQAIREAAKAAYESCDLTFSVYCHRNLVSNLLFSGAPLKEVMQATEEALAFALSTRFTLVVDTILAQLMLVATMQGAFQRTFESHGLGADWNESLVRGAASTSTGAFAYWTHRLQIHVMARQWDEALEAEEKAASLLSASKSHIEAADLSLYGALARAAAWSNAIDPAQRAQHLGALRQYCDELRCWAACCPDNFSDRAALAGAELARIEGRHLDAQSLYEDSIRHARLQGFVQVEAVAQEAAAHYYEKLNLPTLSEACLRNARYAYLHWGAEEKARHIESRLPRAAQHQHSLPPTGPLESQIDTMAVVTASHALSSEIVLPRLLEVLITNVLKHAGAQRCVVALQRDGVLRVETEAKSDSQGARVRVESRSLDQLDLPGGMLLAVARTGQAVLLDDALQHGEFVRDKDVIQRRLRSVLCMPLMKQSHLVGVLYLENNLIAGAFTRERTALLEVLASQAAISLENANLYADVVDSNLQREKAEEQLRHSQEELARVASLTTAGQLVASIAHEVSQPLVSIATSAGAALRWLHRGQPDLVEVSDALQRIEFDSGRARNIIRGLRALIKKSAPTFVPFDINEAIREVLLVTRLQMDRHRILLDDSAISGSRTAWGDRVQMQQVVLNLVANAIEAMEDVNDRSRSLSLSTATVEGMVVFTIQDTGIGIDAGSHERIFAPFVTTKEQGMGMGLSICRSIVVSHRGRLVVKSRVPYGTIFEVAIPATDAQGTVRA